jgi:mannose-6-phosphate isomerase
MERYPIKFAPKRVETLWGSETWLVSAHPVRPTVVANGPYAGRDLPGLFAEFGAELAGMEAAHTGKFPLLVKIVESKDRLSLQVHPNEETAKVSGGDAKTEMWYVLDAARDACLFAGLREGVDAEGLRRMIADGTAEDAVTRLAARRGDVLFIPGGLVHTVGGGCKLYEVQQTSDTTWRLHDWNRIDPATGKPRRTNEREALAAIDFGLPPPEVRDGAGTPDAPAVECRYFRFAAMDLARPAQLPANDGGLRVLFAGEGACDVLVEGRSAVALGGGECVLLPPGTPCTVLPNARCRLLVTDN